MQAVRVTAIGEHASPKLIGRAWQVILTRTFSGHVRVFLMSNGDTEGDNAMFFVAFVKSKDLLIAHFMKVHE